MFRLAIVSTFKIKTIFKNIITLIIIRGDPHCYFFRVCTVNTSNLYKKNNRASVIIQFEKYIIRHVILFV